MKSTILIAFSLALIRIVPDASGATAPINYDTTTGFVITDPTYPFNFPTGKMIGPVMTVYNVKAYPYLARGDDVTDDGPAIRTPISDALLAGGGLVYLPPGSYRFSYLP